MTVAYKITATGTAETDPGRSSPWSINVDRAEELHIEPDPDRAGWVRVRFVIATLGVHSALFDRDGLHVAPERSYRTTQELAIDLSRVTLTIGPADPQ